MSHSRRRPLPQGEDQYGDRSVSQDRLEPDEVIYEARVPKFLQELAHLRGYRHKGESCPKDPSDDETDRQRDEEEALSRALELNPALAKELNPEVVNKAKAVAEKERGNDAFVRKDFATAVASYSTCIELDPTNEVYYSNRSAAQSSLQRYEEALKDAEKVVELKPGWVKGWARMGEAQLKLELFSHSVESYEKALEIDPDNDVLVRARNQAVDGMRRQVSKDKHTFNVGRRKGKRAAEETSRPKKAKVNIEYDDEEDL